VVWVRCVGVTLRALRALLLPSRVRRVGGKLAGFQCAASAVVWLGSSWVVGAASAVAYGWRGRGCLGQWSPLRPLKGPRVRAVSGSVCSAAAGRCWLLDNPVRDKGSGSLRVAWGAICGRRTGGFRLGCCARRCPFVWEPLRFGRGTCPCPFRVGHGRVVALCGDSALRDPHCSTPPPDLARCARTRLEHLDAGLHCLTSDAFPYNVSHTHIATIWGKGAAPSSHSSSTFSHTHTSCVQ